MVHCRIRGQVSSFFHSYSDVAVLINYPFSNLLVNFAIYKKEVSFLYI